MVECFARGETGLLQEKQEVELLGDRRHELIQLGK